MAGGKQGKRKRGKRGHRGKTEEKEVVSTTGECLTTGVWWDVASSPVPDGFDIACVRPCIESVVSKMEMDTGDGPVDIFALVDVRSHPRSQLEAMAASGICIRHTENGFLELFNYAHDWLCMNRAPAYMIMISDGPGPLPLNCGDFASNGYTIIHARPSLSLMDSPKEPEWPWPWRTLLEWMSPLDLKESVAPPCLWHCSLCSIPIDDYDAFTHHFTSTRHERNSHSLAEILNRCASLDTTCENVVAPLEFEWTEEDEALLQNATGKLLIEEKEKEASFVMPFKNESASETSVPCYAVV